MAKGKHKNKKAQQTNSAQPLQTQSQPQNQQQQAKLLDQRHRQLKKQCDDTFAMYAKDIRDTFINKKNGPVPTVYADSPLVDLVDRSMDFMDYDSIHVNYRKQKTLQIAGKLNEYLAELYDEPSCLIDVEQEWVRINALPSPTYDGQDNSAYIHTGAVIWILDQIRKNRKAGELVDLLPDRSYVDDMILAMPDIWDPCFSLDIIEGVECIVQRRNDDCLVGKNSVRFGDWYAEMVAAQENEARYRLAQNNKRLIDEGRMESAQLPRVEAILAEKHTPYSKLASGAKPYPYRDAGVTNRFLLDEPTAEGIHRQDVPSRQRFESLLALIPQDVIDGAVERCEARIWDLAKRYYRCMQFFKEREQKVKNQIKALEEESERRIQVLTGFTLADIRNAQMNGGLPYLIRKKYERSNSSGKKASTMSPMMNLQKSSEYPGIDLADPLGLRGTKNVSHLQNAMPLQNEVVEILKLVRCETGELLAEQEKLEDVLCEYELARIRFNLAFGVMKGDDANRYFSGFGEEIAQIMTDLPKGDPYETCFAFLYMIDRGHELMGCYFPSTSILGITVHQLPWTIGRYNDEDDIIWGGHLFDDASEEYFEEFGNQRRIRDDASKQLQRKKRSSEPEMPDWYDQKYELSDYQEDCPYNLAQIFYKQTGVILPRDMEQYYPVLPELARYGITGKKMTLPLLIGMTIAGNARNQMVDWKNTGLFSEFDQTDDAHAADSCEAADQDGLAEDKDAQIAELKEKLKAAKNEVEKLNHALHAADVKARESKKQIEAQSKQNESQRQELADLRDLLFNYGQGEAEGQNERSELTQAQFSFPYETRHRTLVFGGHDSFLREIKPRLPRVRFVDKNAVPDLALIRNAEVIWIQTNCISHMQYNRMLDAARAHSIPVRYFSFASAEKCAVQLAEADMEMQ